ncbi:MAG: glycoside hydrolase family 127 protein [Armatimonadetes bacterium]|nr:glycoside hydrolase family 127 protein [Armatimonadota bacterium]
MMFAAALHLTALAAMAVPPPMVPVPVGQVVIDDEFWAPKLAVWRSVTLVDCFDKFERDGALTNFDKIRDGVTGEHGGPPWYDGLIYEMIRGSADFLAARRDPALEARLDGYIERIAAAAAKDPDGYVNTYTQLKEPTHRWGLNGGNDNWQHELYNAGAMIEAGVHYYRATGKTRLLGVAVKLANHMADLMGPAPRLNVIPGHSLGEEALVKLYLLFAEQPALAQQMPVPLDAARYLALAEFFIDQHGHHEGRRDFGSYGQDHLPVLQQTTIEGHAVRATLLCTGLVAAAEAAGRDDYLAAAKRLWANMVERRMYVIGGLGSVPQYEGFGPDYVLPNDGYLETCAAIGAGFFHHNLSLATGDGRYADELERVLYNGVLSGVSLAGNTYFYENPLAAGPQRKRWSWHGCPCCPPMFAKIMGALPGYLYAQQGDSVSVNLYAGSRASLTIGGAAITLRQVTRYPWDGRVRVTVDPAKATEFALRLRLPAWCAAPKLTLNGRAQAIIRDRGYAVLRRVWQPGDELTLDLPMPVERVKANPLIEANIGRVALRRGPLVYCVEALDTGGHVRDLLLPTEAPLRAVHDKALLGGVTVIRGTARSVRASAWPGELYQGAQAPDWPPVEFTAIPYYANANREPAEMAVWLADNPLKAEPAPAPVSVAVHPREVLHPVSRLLTGACIEDVNHEIYGGIYSQMVFGESFQEPPVPAAVAGFRTLGGQWQAGGDSLKITGDDGPKLIAERPAFGDGAVGVQVRFEQREGDNAGLIVRVSDAGVGADTFNGYEVALDPQRQMLRLGRHRHAFALLRDEPCEVAVGRWISLEARLTGSVIEILVDGRSVLKYDDGAEALTTGTLGLRVWKKTAEFRGLWVKTGAQPEPLTIEKTPPAPAISGMWRPVRTGQAQGEYALVGEKPFVGAQSQQIRFVSGTGTVGVENQGLNRWGLGLVAGKPYEGLVWARCEQAATLHVALQSRDGAKTYATTTLSVAPGEWRRLPFALTPHAADSAGRLALTLAEPGSVTLGHVFLQPGEWGRFRGLPVRRDVAEKLIEQGVTVLRYGGSMVNNDGYRWRKMIGPRDQRPPYKGLWYPYSSNGWGIVDFMNLCEAAGLEYVPAFNMGETPEDMAAFIDYAKAPADSEWGRRRAADGHPAPYRLRYLQLGNEERVDEAYAARFEALAKAIWARDPAIILVVGDFVYNERIADPFRFGGAASGITSLAGQQRILRLAKEHGREVWFDLHIWTERPQKPESSFDAMVSFINALDKIAEGAKHRVVVFEYNANRHDQNRALGNALATNRLERDGRLPIITSANCLQPDGQNDNGWDQGLLFLNPTSTWLQPPGYVTQMLSRAWQPNVVRCDVSGAPNLFDVTVKASADGRHLVLQVVNAEDQPVTANFDLVDFRPTSRTAKMTQLSGAREATNTAAEPTAIVPRESTWDMAQRGLVFPPRSFTVLRIE